MQFDIELIQEVYASYAEKVEKSRQLLGRPMTLTEKILYAPGDKSANAAGFTKKPERKLAKDTDYVN